MFSNTKKRCVYWKHANGGYNKRGCCMRLCIFACFCAFFSCVSVRFCSCQHGLQKKHKFARSRAKICKKRFYAIALLVYSLLRATKFARTLSKSSLELFLWRESGTQQEFLRKTCSDELPYFGCIFGWFFPALTHKGVSLAP